MSNKLKLLSLLIFPITLIINFIASKFPNVIEKYYSLKINKLIIELLSKISGVFLFSFYEITMYFIAISIILSILYFIFLSIKQRYKAHQRGYSNEDEANFIGYLGAINHPDIDFKYSGYILALVHTSNELAKVDYNKLKELNKNKDTFQNASLFLFILNLIYNYLFLLVVLYVIIYFQQYLLLLSKL